MLRKAGLINSVAVHRSGNDPDFQHFAPLHVEKS